MSIIQLSGRVINSFLSRFGYELHRSDFFVLKNREIEQKDRMVERIIQENETFSMDGALSRSASKDLEIETILDVGASDGQWSDVAMKYFPNAFYFLLEANKVHSSKLKAFKQKHNNVEYILAAAGDKEGEVYFSFDEDDPYGGAASHTPVTKDPLKVPATTLDNQVKENGLKPPFLIKLDTHGFEIPILNGAEDTLTKTNLLVIETYNFKISEETLLFYEMCAHLKSKGFRCIDICCPLHRPTDGAFWQCDIFFIPSNRKEFKSNSYK